MNHQHESSLGFKLSLHPLTVSLVGNRRTGMHKHSWPSVAANTTFLVFVSTEHLKILPRANTMFVFSFQSFPSCLEHVHCRSLISTMLVFQHPAEGRSCSPGEKSRGLTQTPPSPGDGVSPGTGWAYQGLTSASHPPCSLPQGPPAHCPFIVCAQGCSWQDVQDVPFVCSSILSAVMWRGSVGFLVSLKLRCT